MEVNELIMLIKKKIGKVNYNCEYNEKVIYNFFIKELIN